MENIRKPTKEHFGWVDADSTFDGDPGGWMYEGGEETYAKAIEAYNLLKQYGVIIPKDDPNRVK